MSKRVSFLVDGFNVYHSLDTLQGMSGASVKWLDLHKLCTNYLHAVRSGIGEPVELATIHYFSAYANFRKDPDAVRRHKTYLAALKSTGVSVVMSQFKQKDTTCPKCGHGFHRHEEKETDVAIAAKLIEVFAIGECHTVILMTGDTDLKPAIATARRLFRQNKIGVAFPFMRHNRDLENHADYSFKINQQDLKRAQFPPTITLPDGNSVDKPPKW